MASSYVRGNFAALDYLILAAYLVVTLVVGARFVKRQKNLEDYFVAGRSMSWLPAALSVIATVFSAISFVGVPAESFQHDMTLFIATLVVPLVTYFVVALFIPFFHGLSLVSAYEYLERRFSIGVRLLASAAFILLRVGWMATMLYATALIAAEISTLTVPQAVVLTAVVTMAYTFMGGISAVIWTDVLQFFVFVAGIIGIATVATLKAGGLWQIWDIAAQHGKLHALNLSLDPATRMTVWGTLIGGFFLNLSIYGSDQMVIQRYLTTRSMAEARRTMWFNGIFVVPMILMLYLLGVVLFGFYKIHPGLAAGMERPDQVLPYFIVRELPSGLSGFVVAAIFAATMSSMSAGLNSLSTAAIFDFYRRGSRLHSSAAHHLRISRGLTVVFGLVVMALAIYVGRIGSVIEIVYKLNSPFLGVLLGVFLLGILTPRAGARGALLGMVFGAAAVSACMFGTQVSFMWYSAVACLSTFGVGLLTSLLWERPAAEQVRGLTYASRLLGQSAESQRVVPSEKVEV